MTDRTKTICPPIFDLGGIKILQPFPITYPLACKRPFYWISMKRSLVRAARETFKKFTYDHRLLIFAAVIHVYMAEILPIRRKTLYT